MSGSPRSREKRLGVFARPHLAFVDQIVGRQFAHLLLDGLEILGHERTGDDEIVEEPFVCRRADAALRAREQVRDRRREEMRRAVPIERQRLGAPVGDDPDRGVLVERKREIDEAAVHDAGERDLGEAGRDPFRDVAHACAGGQRPPGSVRQCDCDLAHYEV